MQDQYLYEYAVIRIIPKVEREEFLNIGIIIFSKKARFIKLKYRVDENRLNLFSQDLDLNLIRSTLESFQKIADGHPEGGSIAQLEIPERFRWLTAVRSSCIQTSRPHSGLSYDLEKTTETLFREMVL